MFTLVSSPNGLPLNSELHKLPPLPDTPAQPSHQSKQSSYSGLSRSHAAGLGSGLPSSMRLQDLHEIAGSTSQEGQRKSSCKWEVEVDYPILSTRQGGSNPPVGRTPSRDYLRGLPSTINKPERSVVKPRNDDSPNTSSSPSPLAQCVISDPSPSAATSPVAALRPTSSPLKDLSKSPSAAQLTPLLVHACQTASIDANKDDDTHQMIRDATPDAGLTEVLSSSPQRPLPHDRSQPLPQQQPRLSASFILPTYIADASLIADCSLMAGSTSVISEDSFDLAVNRLRPQAVSPIKEKAADLYPCNTSPVNGSDTPSKASSRLRPPRFDNPLDRSTLLPATPARSAHLLAPTNALNNVQPPWAGDEMDMSSASVSSANTISPEKPTSSLPKSQSIRGFPTSISAHSLMTDPTSTTKRTFPSSSSGQSLASVGEELEYPVEAEMSTLLPVSPVKAAHLLSDGELIARETLDEGASFRLPLPPRATPFKASTMPYRSPMRSPAKKSPLKSVFPAHLRAEMVQDGDVTMDVKDLMARVGKPKRASGTEESFVDLLHDNFMPDGLDASMMGPDESMLPSTLRPRSLFAGDGSPLKHYTQLSPVRPLRERQSPNTIKRFPTSRSALPQPPHVDGGASESRSTTISRSKSLSRVAEIIDKVRSERAAAQASELDGPQSRALPKTEIRPRTYTTARTPAPVPASALPTTARPRTSTMPPPATSRRISLSTGALPLPSSASHQISLPAARSAQTHPTSHSSKSSAPAGTAASATSGNSTATARSAMTSSTSSISSSATRTELPLPREGTVARTRPSLAPSQARTELKSRLGSTSSTVSTSAAMSSLPATRTGVRTTFRPTSTAASTTSARAGTLPSARPPRPSVSTRPAGLPQPGTGPSARSAPTNSRSFGADASGAVNRVARPSTIASVAAPTKTSSKVSAGPASSIAAGRMRATTAATGATVKSRALSTPASSVASTRGAVPPPVPSSRLARPSLAPASTHTGLKKTSMPPPSSTAATQRTRVGSTLPRPPSSRLPAASATSGKASATPTTSGVVPTRTSATASAAASNLAALRTRLDALQARQARVAK
ncbi:hypothetical protein I317_03091 [Kwoniella heveanensis CBS 569]|nr:hypothetical protein I317_03091 [Kwoniella heveanensis CBS 569]